MISKLKILLYRKERFDWNELENTRKLKFPLSNNEALLSINEMILQKRASDENDLKMTVRPVCFQSSKSYSAKTIGSIGVKLRGHVN